MRLKLVLLAISISLIGHVCCYAASPGSDSRLVTTDKISLNFTSTTPKGDEIRLLYQTAMYNNREVNFARTFTITVIAHDKNMTLLGGENLEMDETYKKVIKERDGGARFMIELLYPLKKNFYSRMEVLQGFTNPTGITEIQVLKYPLYSNVGGKISDIKSGVLVNAQSVCRITALKITILQILSGDLNNTPFQHMECTEVTPQALVSGAHGEISAIRVK